MLTPNKAAIAVAFAALSLTALGQDKQNKQERPPPKNLKVLKVNSGAEIGPIMRTFNAALGVQCNFCHIQGNFASDENPKKEVARHMITMVQNINAAFPGGDEKKMKVTCYTCHRGEAEPKTAPPAAPPAQ